MKRIHIWEINSFTGPDLSAFLIRIAFGLSFAILIPKERKHSRHGQAQADSLKNDFENPQKARRPFTKAFLRMADLVKEEQ